MKASTYTYFCLKIEEVAPFYRQVIKRCGGKYDPFNQTATGSKITISFVSDEKYNAKGFKLTFKGTFLLLYFILYT